MARSTALYSAGVFVLALFAGKQSGGVLAFGMGGFMLGRLLKWGQQKQQERERVAAAAAEQVRQQEEARLAEQRERERLAAERKRAEDEAREAERKRAELEAEKARLRGERERAAALKALHSHVEVITSAVRSLQPGGDNAVLLNTIDAELKAIGRNAAITAAMIADPEVREDATLIAQMLAEKGIGDKILLNRFSKIFGVSGGADK